MKGINLDSLGGDAEDLTHVMPLSVIEDKCLVFPSRAVASRFFSIHG